MVERKVFLANPKHQYHVSKAITKRMEIIISIHVYLISQTNFNYKENGGNKSFSSNQKLQYRVSQCGELDCSANKKEN